MPTQTSQSLFNKHQVSCDIDVVIKGAEGLIISLSCFVINEQVGNNDTTTKTMMDSQTCFPLFCFSLVLYLARASVTTGKIKQYQV